jgi:hypothetical protein
MTWQIAWDEYATNNPIATLLSWRGLAVFVLHQQTGVAPEVIDRVLGEQTEVYQQISAESVFASLEKALRALKTE